MAQVSKDENAAADPATAAEMERELRHRILAARTVAVSFRAAMESAERHLQVPQDEREAIKERWRAWALETLSGYATDLDALLASTPVDGAGPTEALEKYRVELDRAFDIVRTTVGD